MRICIVSSSFSRHEGDNSAPWLLRLATELRARGDDARVFAPSYMGRPQVEASGVPVTRFRYAPAAFERLTHEDSSPANLHRFAYKLLVLSFAACGFLRACLYFAVNRFDAVDVHWPFPQAVFALPAKIFGRARLVYYLYATELLLIQGSPLMKAAFSFMLRFADDLVAISNPSRELLEREFPQTAGRVKVIPFGTTLPEASPAPKALAPGEPLRLLYVGKLIERKGITYLLSAARLLKDRGLPFTLTLVGDGYLRAELESQAASLGLADLVSFRGFLLSRSQELCAEYLKAHVFVFPSIVDSRGDTEGLGYVAMDALFFGLPVIASDVGGIPELIKDGGTGYLVPQKDPEALAAAIAGVAADYPAALKTAAAGRDYAEKNFSWDSVVERLRRVYGGKP